MSQPHTFEFDGDEYTVQDPSNGSSWVEALGPFIDRFAEEHCTTQWQADRDGVSDDSLRKIAEIIPDAIREYRALSEADREKTTFANTLIWKLTEAFEEDFGHGDVQSDAMYSAGIQQYFDELWEAIEAVDGPVADEDEVWEFVKQAIVDKMWEHDDSTILDWLGNPAVPLSFSPECNPAAVDGRSHSVDDLMIYTENFGSYGPCLEIDAMAKLLRMNLRMLMPLLQIDYKDSEKIRLWVKHSIDIDKDLPPVINRDQFKDLLDNCGSTYAYPEWVGCLDLEEISKLDPLKPMKLTQGVIAFLDIGNGAGHTVDMSDDAFLIVYPDQSLSPERGRYSLYEIMGDRPSATVKNCDVELLKEEYRESLRPKKMDVESLDFD